MAVREARYRECIGGPRSQGHPLVQRDGAQALWPTLQCDPVSGYIYNDFDCDDTDIDQHDFAVWYRDQDLDGLGTGDPVRIGCADANHLTLENGDCDDSDSLDDAGGCFD